MFVINHNLAERNEQIIQNWWPSFSFSTRLAPLEFLESLAGHPMPVGLTELNDEFMNWNVIRHVVNFEVLLLLKEMNTPNDHGMRNIPYCI